MSSVLLKIHILAGVPGMSAACQAVLALYDIVENVKIHKNRCKHLRGQCIEILFAFEHYNGSFDDPFAIGLSNFEANVLDIHSRMVQWSNMDLVTSIIRQKEISGGLDELQEDLRSSINQLSNSGALNLSQQRLEQRQNYENDQFELREELLNIVRHQDSLRSTLALLSTYDVEQLMQTIQVELQQSENLNDDTSSIIRQQIEATFPTLQMGLLSPIIDLTSEVKQLSQVPVRMDGSSDIYIGEWLDQEKVALKFSRHFNQSAEVQKMFADEVSFWRDLKHENVLRVYGVANFSGGIYTVSPWIEDGNAAEYLANHPDANRRKMMYEVAQGVQYLHTRGIAHGNLRCSNVLITRDGTACISDFGLIKLLGDIGGEPVVNILDNLRWTAPEPIVDQTKGRWPIITLVSDVWSYGMLCLELMTGQPPYHAHHSDAAVVTAISKREVPNRPSIGIDNKLWKLMNDCWERTPQNRPTMAQIVYELSGSVSEDKAETPQPDSQEQAYSVAALSERASSSEQATISDILPRMMNNGYISLNCDCSVFRCPIHAMLTQMGLDLSKLGGYDDSLKVQLGLYMQSQSRDAYQFAVTLDDEHIQLYQDLLSSMAHGEFTSSEEVVAPVMKHSRKMVRKLAKERNIFPARLFVEEIRRMDAHPVTSGGFADIWRGYKTINGKDDVVAIKVPRITTTASDEELQAIQKNICQEVLHWQYFDHPNVVSLLGLCRDHTGGPLCMVLPWFRRGNIIRYLKANRNVNRWILLLQTTRGVHYLHSFDPGLVHGDIKGANILIDEEGNAKVTDFGLMKITESQRELTSTLTQSSAGSTRWMAPELLQDQCVKTFATDVFALGMTIVEVMTLLAPFHEISLDVRVIMKIIRGETPARPSPEVVSDSLWHLMCQCWSMDPNMRPTVAAIIAELEHLEPLP